MGMLVHVPPVKIFTGGCPSAQTHPLGWGVFNETLVKEYNNNNNNMYSVKLINKILKIKIIISCKDVSDRPH